MDWEVAFHVDFNSEFYDLSEAVRDAILTKATLLAKNGPSLRRPHVDTLKGSKHANMKELRFDADDGVWRVAFAFDPERKATLLTAGDKVGVNEKLFYRNLISKADARFDQHLTSQERRK